MRRIILIAILLHASQFAFTQNFNRNSNVFRNFLTIGQNGSYASIPQNSIWTNQNDFTIETIVRFNKPLNPTGGAIFINTVGPSAGNDWGWGFVAIDNRFGFHVCSPQPTQNMANQTDTISACTWYHLAGVKQGNSIRFYLNGELKGTASFPDGQQIRTSTGPAQFGFHRPPYQNWFDGNIDEFRLWNFARSQAQIQSKMNDTLLGNEAGLQAYYKFNETGQGNGVVVTNSAQASGSQLNGATVSSAPTFPKFANSETLNYPLPPLVPTQPVLCQPGGQFNLSVNSPTGLNINRFYWYNSNHPDTSRIPNTIRKTYKTPNLSQTDTFFVSSVSSQFCESKKVVVVAKVLPPLSTVTVVSSKTSFCNSTDLTLTATVFPGARYSWWRGYNGLIPVAHPDSSAVLQVSNLTNSDTLWVQYKSIEGNCLSNKAFVVITKFPKSPAPVLSNSLVRVCVGTNASFSVSGTGTRTVRLFSDSNLTQLLSQGGFNQTIQTPVIQTDRTFWISLSADVNGCESFGSKFIVHTDPLPLVVAGVADTVCSGSAFQLGQTGNPAYHYQWTPAPFNLPGTNSLSYNSDTVSNPQITLGSFLFQPIPQSFKLTATNRITGCKNADSVTITVGSLPPGLDHSDTSICGNVSIKLNRVLDPVLAANFDQVYQYQWTTNFGVLQNPTSRTATLIFGNLGQTQIISRSILLKTDSRTGCNSRDTVYITSNPLPNVEAGNSDTVCAGVQIQLGAAGNAGYAYQWAPAPVNSLLFSVNYNSDTISNPILSIISSNFVLSPTKFKLTARNRITQCMNIDSVFITPGFKLPHLARGDTNFCGNAVIQMAKSLDPGQESIFNLPDFQYNWTIDQGGTFQNPNIRKSIFSNTNLSQSPIPSTAILTIIDTRTGCLTRDTVKLISNPLPIVFAGVDSAICSGFSIPIGFPGNAAATRYSWVNPSGISNDTISNPNFTFVIPTGNISIQKILTATFRNTGCKKSDTIQILVHSLPKPNAGQNQEFCFNGTTTLGTNSMPGFHYNWSPTDSLMTPNNGQTSIRYFNSDTLEKNLVFVLQMKNDTSGCIGNDTVLVRIKGYIIAEVGADQSLCSGNSVIIGIPGRIGHTYQWPNSFGLSTPLLPQTAASVQNINITNGPDTVTYKRIATFDGCQNADSLKVVVFPRPKNLQIAGSKNVCPGTMGTEYFVISNPYLHSLVWSQSGGNFVGNNSGDTIRINWGETNPNGKVRFLPTNIYGCTGDSVIYNVQINKLLFPEIDIISDRSLVHNDSVCHYEAKAVIYRTKFTTPGSSYEWNIVPPSAGTILGNPKGREISVRWNAPGTYQLFVSQFDTTNIDTCFGTSQVYTVNILPSPDTTLFLVGDSIVCAFTTKVLYQFQGNPTSTFNWIVSRPGENTFQQQTPGNILVNYGGEAMDSIQVLETNTVGCKGKWTQKLVAVKPLPNTIAALTNDYNVCPGNNSKLGYRVSGLPGSYFNWLISGNVANPIGQGTDSLTLDWTGNTGGLKVVETSAFGCRKDTLNLSLNFDPSKLVLNSVSTLENDDRKIEVSFELKEAQNHPDKTFELWRNGTLISAFNSTQTSYIDELVETQTTVYNYQVKTKNSCKALLESVEINNILLHSSANPIAEKSELQWNRYISNSNDQIGYELLRKVDETILLGSFGRVNYIPSIQPENIQLSSDEIYDGFQQCYRIKAIQNEFVSYSNWSCVNFENPLIFPNLITPNGDDKNDTFEVKNLKLYPDAEFQVFDRWGNSVYTTSKYENEWAGPEGLYFYTFKSGSQQVKGWISVVK